MLGRLLLISLSLATACACPATPAPTPGDARPDRSSADRGVVTPDALPPWDAGRGAGRIVAIGDVHGDLTAARNALRLAGAIDEHDRWVGGALVVVQVGDQLDRGDEDRQVLELFGRLADEAPASGGQVLSVLGNHETMNVDGWMDYVTEGGFRAFDDLAGLDVDNPELRAFPAHERARRAAFLPGGPYARRLIRRDVVVQLGETVFVHGGVLPGHLGYGLTRINDETRRWIAGEAPRPSHVGDGPLWTTVYSSTVVAPGTCAVLDEVLAALSAKRMVVAHVVQGEGITSACSGRVWRIDVGLARYYGGPVEVLELTADAVAPLIEKGAR